MSSKKSTEVLIGGKVYTLSGYEEEEYLTMVASYINNKLSEINDREDMRKLPADMKATLLELNIADDYFKAKQKIDKFEAEMESKEEELYELKHDLISHQIRLEDIDDKIKTLEKENKELLKTKSRLESSLEDVLLGTTGSNE